MASPHHISPSLDEQLVLELEAWIAVDEAVGWPMLWARLANAPAPAARPWPSECALWNRLRRAVVGGGQRWWCCWWCPHKLLQQPDVEHIVQPGARRQLKAVGDVVDDGCDAVGPVESGPELPLGD